MRFSSALPYVLTALALASFPIVATAPMLAAAQQIPAQPAFSAPTRMFIPSISLDDPVVRVGITQSGAMAVPSGSTNQVGWYESGTVPGQIGSAVFDAHVFAAFSNLSGVKPGDDIYVQEGSQLLHFVVGQAQTYPLAALSPAQLFSRAGGRYLTLITCAGKYIPAQGTYNERLVVYAQLANQ